MPDEPYFQQEVFTFVLLSRIFLFFEQDFVYKLLFSQRSLRLRGELLFVFWLQLCCSRFFVIVELCPYHTVVPDMIKLTALGPGISKGSRGAGEFRFEGCRERLRKRSTTALGA